MAEETTPAPGDVARKVHNLAKAAAVRDLVNLHPGAYEVLRAGWLDHYRRELGWADARAEANRARREQERRNR